MNLYNVQEIAHPHYWITASHWLAPLFCSFSGIINISWFTCIIPYIITDLKETHLDLNQGPCVHVSNLQYDQANSFKKLLKCREQHSYILTHCTKRSEHHVSAAKAWQEFYAVFVPDCFLDPHYVVSSAEERDGLKNVTVGSALILSGKSPEANAKYIHIVSHAFQVDTGLLK